MAQEDKTSSATELPGWLIGIFWSIIGVAVAVLTVIILTAYFLWLVWWGGLVGPPGNQAALATTGQIASGNADESVSGQNLTEAQAATATAVQLNGAPAPGGLSTQASQTSDQPAPASSSPGQTGPEVRTTLGADTAEPGDAEGEGGSGGSQGGSTEAGGRSTQPEQTGAAASAAGQDDQPDEQTVGTSATPSPTATLTPSPTSTNTPTSTPTNTPTPSPTPTPEPQEYIVQTDDWLSRLSDKFYDDVLAYPAIVEATNAKAAEDDSYTFINDPDVIEVGQKLWIPTLEEAEILLAGEEK